MTENVEIFIACGILTGFTVAMQHMAFRTPYWRDRELIRRAVGDSTVLVLFFLMLVMPGWADLRTWIGIVGMFAIAGIVKAAYQWFDATRRAGLLARMERHDESADVG